MAASGAVTGKSDAQLAGQAPLQVYLAGFGATGTTLRNGGVVPLAPEVNVEVFVNPYPASGSTVWLDLFLTARGKAINNAAVACDNEMAYMTHGSTHQDGANSGDGHYVFSMNYPMVGPWRHFIRFQMDNQHYELPLVVTVYPS